MLQGKDAQTMRKRLLWAIPATALLLTGCQDFRRTEEPSLDPSLVAAQIDASRVLPTVVPDAGGTEEEEAYWIFDYRHRNFAVGRFQRGQDGSARWQSAATWQSFDYLLGLLPPDEGQARAIQPRTRIGFVGMSNETVISNGVVSEGFARRSDEDEAPGVHVRQVVRYVVDETPAVTDQTAQRYSVNDLLRDPESDDGGFVSAWAVQDGRPPEGFVATESFTWKAPESERAVFLGTTRIDREVFANRLARLSTDAVTGARRFETLPPVALFGGGEDAPMQYRIGPNSAAVRESREAWVAAFTAIPVTPATGRFTRYLPVSADSKVDTVVVAHGHEGKIDYLPLHFDSEDVCLDTGNARRSTCVAGFLGTPVVSLTTDPSSPEMDERLFVFVPVLLHTVEGATETFSWGIASRLVNFGRPGFGYPEFGAERNWTITSNRVEPPRLAETQGDARLRGIAAGKMADKAPQLTAAVTWLEDGSFRPHAIASGFTFDGEFFLVCQAAEAYCGQGNTGRWRVFNPFAGTSVLNNGFVSLSAFAAASGRKEYLGIVGREVEADGSLMEGVREVYFDATAESPRWRVRWVRR